MSTSNAFLVDIKVQGGTQIQSNKHPNNVAIFTKTPPATAFTDGFKLFNDLDALALSYNSNTDLYKIFAIMLRQPTNPLRAGGTITVIPIPADTTLLECFNIVKLKTPFSKIIATEIFTGEELTAFTEALEAEEEVYRALLGTDDVTVIEANVSANKVRTDFVYYTAGSSTAKSTLLQVIAGIVAKECGRIYSQGVNNTNAFTENIPLIGVIGDKVLNNVTAKALKDKGAILYLFNQDNNTSFVSYSAVNKGRFGEKISHDGIKIVFENGIANKMQDPLYASGLIYNDGILQATLRNILTPLGRILIGAGILQTTGAQWDTVAIPIPQNLDKDKVERAIIQDGFYLDIASVLTLSSAERGEGKGPSITLYMIVNGYITTLGLVLTLNK